MSRNNLKNDTPRSKARGIFSSFGGVKSAEAEDRHSATVLRPWSSAKEDQPRLKVKYQKEIIPALQKEFGIKNPLAVPKVVRVVINVGIGERGKKKETLINVMESLKMITGQKPLLTKAKKAIAEFKTREGDVVGLKVTLRGKRMYYFLDKFFSIVLPRIRDFQGLRRVFDNQANYTLGLREQTIFSEVDYDKIDRLLGMSVTIITNSKAQKQTERLFELQGMPFEKAKSAK